MHARATQVCTAEIGVEENGLVKDCCFKRNAAKASSRQVSPGEICPIENSFSKVGPAE